MDDDFYLPMSHRANDPLETSGVDMATVDTAVPDSNKGYQMLCAMGWKEGVGLGRKEDGAPLCIDSTACARSVPLQLDAKDGVPAKLATSQHNWVPDLGDGDAAGCKLLHSSVVPQAASTAPT